MIDMPLYKAKKIGCNAWVAGTPLKAYLLGKEDENGVKDSKVKFFMLAHIYNDVDDDEQLYHFSNFQEIDPTTLITLSPDTSDYELIEAEVIYLNNKSVRLSRTIKAYKDETLWQMLVRWWGGV